MDAGHKFIFTAVEFRLSHFHRKCTRIPFTNVRRNEKYAPGTNKRRYSRPAICDQNKEFHHSRISCNSSEGLFACCHISGIGSFIQSATYSSAIAQGGSSASRRQLCVYCTQSIYASVNDTESVNYLPKLSTTKGEFPESRGHFCRHLCAIASRHKAFIGITAIILVVTLFVIIAISVVLVLKNDWRSKSETNNS
jgi:hypothetical protein